MSTEPGKSANLGQVLQGFQAQLRSRIALRRLRDLLFVEVPQVANMRSIGKLDDVPDSRFHVGFGFF